MGSLPVRDVTALNITNAALGLSVLAIWVFVVIQALREARLGWQRRGAREHPTVVHGKRG